MKHVSTAIAASVVALAIAHPASALEIANGAFGFIPVGSVTMSPVGDITAATAEASYGAAIVNIAGTGNLPMVIGDAVLVSGPFEFAAGLGEGPTSVPLDITVSGLTFTFDYEKTITRVATAAGVGGAIAASYWGMLSDGGGIFEVGAVALMSMSCDQIVLGAPVNCSNTTVTVNPVSEPASMVLLSIALAGLGLLFRAKTANT